jgi:hypothetical protein
MNQVFLLQCVRSTGRALRARRLASNGAWQQNSLDVSKIDQSRTRRKEHTAHIPPPRCSRVLNHSKSRARDPECGGGVRDCQAQRLNALAEYNGPSYRRFSPLWRIEPTIRYRYASRNRCQDTRILAGTRKTAGPTKPTQTLDRARRPRRSAGNRFEARDDKEQRHAVVTK